MLSLKTDYYFVFGISLLIICFEMYDFGLPALWPDEPTWHIMALSLLNKPGSDLYNLSGSEGWHIGAFPLQFAPYIGTVASYTSLPMTFLLGPTVAAVRSYCLVISVLLVVMIYYTGKEIFSRRVGMIASILFSVFPTFVFYSRQDISYDWIFLSISLLITIFAIRFLRTMKIRYIALSFFLIGIGIWGYLWFVWFLLGLLISMPIWFNIFRNTIDKKNRFSDHLPSQYIIKNYYKIKLLIISAVSLTIGVIPLIIHYFVSSYWSLIPFLLRSVMGGDKGYLSASNANLLENLVLRTHHFYEIFTQPNTGFIIANLNYTWNETSYVYLILFFATISVCVIHIVHRQEKYKSIACLMLISVTIFFSSIVTVTDFTNLQLGIMLPFTFIVMAKGLDKIASNNRILYFSSIFKKKTTSNHVILIILIIVVFLQVPIIIEGYKILGSVPSAQYHIPYEEINQYITKNNLVPVAFDFFTQKNFLFDTNGKQVPYIIHGDWEGRDFNENVKRTMKTAESLGLVDEKYLFVVYTFPHIEEECKDGVNFNSAISSNQCAEYYFVESAAKRNNLKIEIKDFTLPDGTPYLRGLRLVANQN